MFTSGSSIYGHEINYKLGPYFKLGSNSYFAVASGLSLIIVSSRVGNGQGFSNPDLEPGNFVMNIPIHFRINIEVYKIFCIGLKATYNIPVEKYYIDRGTALIYFAFKI